MKRCAINSYNERKKTVRNSIKSLMLASLVGCMSLGVQNAQATTVSEVDMSERPLGTPTLDYLNKNNVTVTDLDNENPVLVPPSSYTLTKVDAA